MKSQAIRRALTLLCPLLLLFVTSPVLKAGETGRISAEINTPSLLNPPTPDQQLLINLMVLLPGNGEGLADGLRMRFNTGYLKSIEDDALKMHNFSENLSSYRESTELIVERRPPIVSQDTVFLRLTNTTIREYRFKMYAKSFAQNMLAYVEDGWLNTYKVINLSGDTTNFDFNVTANPASQASNRFKVIFVTFGTLPIYFTGISALPGYNSVQVKWTTANDKEVAQYEIERSYDGTNFSIVGTVYSGSNSGYSWMDEHPLRGISYYRIRSTVTGGEMIYSSVVKADVKNGGSSITVYPNPVPNHILQINLSGLESAVYSLLLVNNVGEVVMQQSVKHVGRNASYTISLNSAVLPGRYSLLIRKPGGSPLQKSLIVL